MAAVERRGKYLVVRFETGRVLLIHLRMTGSLLHAPRGAAADDAYVRAVVRLDNGSDVAYRDVRRFGTWLLLEPGELEPYLAERIGREPLGSSLTARSLADRLARRKAPLEGRRPRPARLRGRREHLRGRSALVGAPPSASSREHAHARGAPGPGAGDSEGPPARDRPPGSDAPRLPQRERRDGSHAGGVPRLRPRRRGLHALRPSDREDARRRPRNLVLPELPALTRDFPAGNASTL